MSHTPATLRPAWVGIDVAKVKLDVVVFVNGKRHHRVFANSPEGFALMQSWWQTLAAQPERICLEATGSYSDALADWLFAQSLLVCVLNPAVLVAYRKAKEMQSKTDKADAGLLALYAQEQQPRAYHPVSEAVRTLRSLRARRDDLLQMVQQERNRLEANRLDAWSRERVQAHVAYLSQELETLDERISTLIEQHSELSSTAERLQTIKGIGPVAAATLLACIGDIARFPDASALVASAGLAVKERQSGSSVRGRPQINRCGNLALRQVLYMCALVSMRWDPHMRAWAERLRARGKPAKVVIVAVMRKLLHIVYGVWKHERDYDPALAFPNAA